MDVMREREESRTGRHQVFVIRERHTALLSLFTGSRKPECVKVLCGRAVDVFVKVDPSLRDTDGRPARQPCAVRQGDALGKTNTTGEARATDTRDTGRFMERGVQASQALNI
jgi:hypothetical protein